MALGFIIAILLIGFVLIFLEVFVIPGTSLFGIAGGLAVITGVALMYYYYGVSAGHVTLIASSVLSVFAIFMAFKVIRSNRLAMKAEIKGKVNEVEVQEYAIGERGIAATELRPNGKVYFGENKVEVFSTGDYIAKNSTVEIVKLNDNRIIVKPVK